jgi:hypothetical protein
MLTETKTPNKFADAPRDKPQGDRVEHANLERPGAQAHPRARSTDWSRYAHRAAGWQWH